MNDNKRIMVMDYNLDALTMEETVSRIQQMIQDGCSCQHVVLNAGKVVMANKDPQLREIINQCEMINADGQSIVWAARLLGEKVPERVTGIDLMYRLFALAEANGYGVYFFGAREEVLKRAVANILQSYPGLIVAGQRNGYFNAEQLPDIIQDMRSSQAKILLVGISSPTKEYWLKENMSKIDIPFCMGVGGSFDVAAGEAKRAPLSMQKMGMEWFYRFMQEPRRLWERYLIGNMSFVLYVIRCKFARPAAR